MIDRVTSSLLPASVAAALMLVGCASAPPSDDDEAPLAQKPPPAEVAPLDVVAALLAGRFDSTAQAARDARYFDVSLRACLIDLGDFASHALYVEQAMMDSLDAPYRQRAYVLEAGPDNAAVSHVFELKQPGRFVGLCDDTADAGPVVADLVGRDGCAVTLQEQGGAYVGGTTGKGCASTLQGAAYATSEVTLTATQIRSWDRGFDENDRQVWGAQAGPYEFDRID